MTAETLLKQYEPKIQALGHAARSGVLAAFPGAAESVDEKARMLAYSYGPGYKGLVATLIFSKGGVKIGIPFGAGLPDPAGLLAGAGKLHRHIAVKEIADLKAAAVKALLKESRKAWRARSA